MRKMKIKTEQQHFREGNRTRTETKIEYCCESMREAMDEGFIAYGDHPNEDINFQVNQPLDADSQLRIFALNEPFGEWKAKDINHCPFCGAGYEIEFHSTAQ